MFRPYLLSFLLSFGVTVSNSFARFAYALVLPAMRSELHWNYVQSGWLNTANAIGYLIGAIVTRLAIRHTGNRRLFIGGVLLTALCVLATGFTRDIFWLGFWRMASGVTGAATFISGGALSANVAPGQPRLASTTTAIYFAGGGIGFILCGATIPLLLDVAGPSAWPQAWIWMGVAGLVAFALCAWAAWQVDEPNIETPGSAGVQIPVTDGVKHLRPALIAYALFGLGYIAYMTFVIAWIRDHGGGTGQVIAVWCSFGVASLLAVAVAPSAANLATRAHDVRRHRDAGRRRTVAAGARGQRVAFLIGSVVRQRDVEYPGLSDQSSQASTAETSLGRRRGDVHDCVFYGANHRARRDRLARRFIRLAARWACASRDRAGGGGADRAGAKRRGV